METGLDSSRYSLTLGICPVLSPPTENWRLCVCQTKCGRGDDMQFPRLGFKGHCIFHLFSLDPLHRGKLIAMLAGQKQSCGEGLRLLFSTNLSAT